jgi:sensor histidine kinase regulating citrate/malate metabolism
LDVKGAHAPGLYLGIPMLVFKHLQQVASNISVHYTLDEVSQKISDFTLQLSFTIFPIVHLLLVEFFQSLLEAERKSKSFHL